MLPKSSKHFIKPTADLTGCDSELVEDIVAFYYKDVRRALTEMQGPNIQVENLGSFKAKRNELPKLVSKFKKQASVIVPETFARASIKKEIETKLKRVKHLQFLMTQEYQRKLKFIKDNEDKEDLGK